GGRRFSQGRAVSHDTQVLLRSFGAARPRISQHEVKMNRKPLGLFEAFGIELEYMIVDAESLDVKPCADQLMQIVGGGYDLEVERGAALWSNELALHVIEMKTNGPASKLKGLTPMFVEQVNDILD